MTTPTTPKKGLWLHGSSGRMGREIQRAIIEGPESSQPFRLSGGSAAKFEGEGFHQGQPVTKDLLAAALERNDVDVILDFTGDAGNALLLESIESNANVANKALLIGTTGLSTERLGYWREITSQRNLATLIAPNTSIGILLTLRAALSAAGVLARLGFDIEIVEAHHRHKKDSPSGTARFIGEALSEHINALNACHNESGNGRKQFDLLPKYNLVSQRLGARQPGEIGMHSVRGGAIFGEHDVRLIGEAEEIIISHKAFSRALFASGAIVLAGWLVRQKPAFYSLMDVNIDDLSAPSNGPR